MTHFKFTYVYDNDIKYALAVSNQPFQAANHSHNDKSGYLGVAHTFLSPWNSSHFGTTSDAPNTVSTEGTFNLSDVTDSLIGFMIHKNITGLSGSVTIEIDGIVAVTDTFVSHTHSGWLIDHLPSRSGLPRGQPTYLEKLDSTDQFTKSQYIPRYRR